MCNQNNQMMVLSRFYHHTPFKRNYLHPAIITGFSNQRFRHISSIPRATFQLFRLPFIIGSVGAGAIAVVNAKIEYIKQTYVPDWLKSGYEYITSLHLSKTSSNQSDGSNQNGGGNQHSNPIFPVLLDDDYNDIEPAEDSNVLTQFTKRIIHIRNLLKAIKINDKDFDIQLPSIVVIGSQSSGKSSVLESIVGQEFLPKGSNMVTKRPIELTLIHTPQSNHAFGIFPKLGLGKIYDFKKIQRILIDMNLAVTDEECVSDIPIELEIYSNNVPDLQLIDLPGYIQISTKNQPLKLREKIQALCERYIQAPNIILAVSAADVDLANSEALRASKSADPLGQRTIGIITKLDLVTPSQGINLLKNAEYPLELGYVGVIGKKGSPTFSLAEYTLSTDINTGTSNLKNILVKTLTTKTREALSHIQSVLQKHLQEVRYKFKVEYNDEVITADGYVSGIMDGLKSDVKAFLQKYGKAEMRSGFKSMLWERSQDIIKEIYSDVPVAQFMAFCTNEQSKNIAIDRLNMAASALTKSGIGKHTTENVQNFILDTITAFVSSPLFLHHPETRGQIIQYAQDTLSKKLSITIDQVENTIKPYKQEIEITPTEWKEAHTQTIQMIEKQVKEKQEALYAIRQQIGRRKFKRALVELERIDMERKVIIDGAPIASEVLNRDTGFEASVMSANVLQKVRLAQEYQKEVVYMQQRLSDLSSRKAKDLTQCHVAPEVYLFALSEKLSQTAALFISIELLHDFASGFPRELDCVWKSRVKEVCDENVGVKSHLAVQEKKNGLERVIREIDTIMTIDT